MTTSCSRADWRCGEAKKSYIRAGAVIDFFAIISAEDENCHGETSKDKMPNGRRDARGRDTRGKIQVARHVSERREDCP